jgi:hypothetical protein
MPRPVRRDLEALGAQIAPELSRQHVGRAVMAWSELIGMISFELFGHLHNVIHDYAAHFDYQMRGVVAELGLG